MKPVHILLAEDSRADILLIRHALAEHLIQHELHIVTDGEQAIEFMLTMGKPGGTPCPDVMLLDLNLPKADGTEILTEFRKHLECVETPVIIVTSSDAPKDRAQVAQLGVRHYFKKPSDYEGFMKLGALVLEVVQSDAV